MTTSELSVVREDEESSASRESSRKLGGAELGVSDTTCAVMFVRLADGARVPCVLAAGHECAHAFGRIEQ